MAPIKGTQIIPLGGVGEFGANATIVRTSNTTILIDFGLMFPPDARQPGVDFFVIDPDFLSEHFPNIDALFVTHGHEDHIGGIRFLLDRNPLPIYTMPYTAELIRHSTESLRPKPKIHTVELNKPVTLGDFEVEFVGVTHSIPFACSLAVRSPDGLLLHSGDFKVDPLPDDQHPFQSQRFAELGKAGVDLLIVDSTNANKQGFCPSEAEIHPYYEDLIANARGRVFFTTFASHMTRFKRIMETAKRTGRKILLLGRSFNRHFQTSINQGYFGYDPSLFVDLQDVGRIPDAKLLFVATGSQAERTAALSKLMNGEMQGLRFKSTDTVLFSSRSIPGNERQIAIFTSALENMGIQVVTGRDDHIHTSGHAYREDIAYLVRLLHPRYLAPIHGEYHQLLQNESWLRELTDEGQEVLYFRDGNQLTLLNHKLALSGQIEPRLLPVDGTQGVPITPHAMRERKDLMYSGLILISAEIDRETRLAEFEIDGHGLAEARPGLIYEKLFDALESQDFDYRLDENHWAETLFQAVRKALKSVHNGRPMIKIVVNGRIKR